MQKLGDVVTLSFAPEQISFLVGNSTLVTDPIIPFEERICDFLNDLSATLRNLEAISHYPDVATFAFWCRQANIHRIREEYSDRFSRLGLGLVFHIAPSNVPVNFAYSFAFGL